MIKWSVSATRSVSQCMILVKTRNNQRVPYPELKYNMVSKEAKQIEIKKSQTELPWLLAHKISEITRPM